ncbi:MAG: zf-HC2 domain-containing protein [Blastocatellia bacterium]|nr:zf-HC2 domain-containing protein [Blastocatellia bacterium]
MFRNHVHNQLSAYLHDELSAEQARRVAEHLLRCPRCRAMYEEARFGAQMAAHLAKEAAPEGLWRELQAEMNEADAATSRRGDAVRARRGPRWAMAGLAATLAFGVAALALLRKDERPSWEVTRLAGRPEIGARTMDAKGRLPLDEWLTTDEASRAQISVGQIGEVKIEPGSRVRLAAAQGDEHRLELARGRLEAFIWAPPRQFFVDTPSARAVDLGCSYTLEVDDHGEGRLRVTMGWVAFEWQGRESFVPAGASCVTRPTLGPGTPWFDDAGKPFVDALAALDRGDAGALETVLAESRARDALTLWHLLSRTRGAERGAIFDRLAALVPPPPNATRDGVFRGDPAMLDAWWEKLGLGDAEWWRIWKGPPPN